LKKITALIVLILLGAAAWIALAPVTPAHETFVEIPAGTGTAGIAARLEKAGVIRSRYAFEAVRMFKGGALKAGEYRFVRSATVANVYARIARGDTYTLTLSIPEGFNMFDIAHAAEAAGLGSATNFLAAARRDTGLIADLSPHAASLEGFLFPDTYKFSPHVTDDQMVQAMVNRFRTVSKQNGLPRGPALAATVTLASIIEKEVGVDRERALVASVFANRLARGMKLETDPTVIYAAQLAGRWRGVIHQSDLSFDSPYNTYRRTGLPPGPIANPGLAALQAAEHPAQTDFLYFVADAQGHTRFSATLEEHRQQVNAYRAALTAAP
jgi:UPF0755 protein